MKMIAVMAAITAVGVLCVWLSDHGFGAALGVACVIVAVVGVVWEIRTRPGVRRNGGRK